MVVVGRAGWDGVGGKWMRGGVDGGWRLAQGCAVVYGRGQRGVVLGGVALAAWRARGARGVVRGGRRGGWEGA